MGFLTTLRLKADMRRKQKEEYARKAHIDIRKALAEERKTLAVRKERAQAKAELSNVKREIRADKLRPLTNVVSSFRGALKKAGERSQKREGGNDLFASTKTADDLLGFPKKKAAPLPKKKAVLTKRVIEEYR